MVLEFLTYVRTKRKMGRGEEGYSIRKAIDTAIIKLNVDLDNIEGLNDFLNSSDSLNCDEADIVDYFKKNKRYHALGVFYRTKSMDEEALILWKEIGEGRGNLYSGAIQDTINLLSTSSDNSLIFKYSKWVLDRKLMDGLSIFTSTFREEPLPVDKVLNFLIGLKRNGNLVAEKYLEFVVFQVKTDEGKYHTRLAHLYVDSLLPLCKEGITKKGKPAEPGSEPGELGPLRRQMIKLLEFSEDFDAAGILKRIDGTILYQERVLCCRALGKHSEALRILVKKLKSYVKATTYCAKYQSKDRDGENLFLQLLKVYLKRSRENLPRSVHQLLSDYSQHLPPNHVIPLLSEKVKISDLKLYLVKSLRFNQSQTCTGQVEMQLRKVDKIEQHLNHSQVVNRKVEINDETKCGVCRDLIGDKVFVWYPNGTVCHFKCKKADHICPVTRRNFKKDPYVFLNTDTK